MSRKRNDYKPQSFETVGKVRYNPNGALHNDTFATIYDSMLLSDAFQDLNSTQQILYIICKKQFYGARKPHKDYPDMIELAGDDKFYLNVDIAINRYHLYSPKSKKNFYTDMQVLISHGFIERVASGKAHRTKTIYKYSAEWKKWKRTA